MITVVISTRKKEEAYLTRISETAGTQVEILCYENNNQYSLTEVYNKGLSESTNDIVIFMHDDLLFEGNSRWGQKIEQAFESSEYGILGKAGTTHFPKSARWWEDAGAMCGRVYHQQLHPKTGKLVRWASEYSGHLGNNIAPVVVVDGLFFAVHKQRIKHQFDESIKGFHMYDIDFCLANYLDGVKIGVMFNFDIIHKSIGETNQEWEMNRVKVAEKYVGKIPLHSEVELFYENKQVKFKKKKENLPMVSIIVPTKGRLDLVMALTTSIARTIYPNYEFILADTGSNDEEKAQLQYHIRELKLQNIMNARMVEYDYYNFAKINNDVVRNHIDPKSELILFCNNDIVLQNDCLSMMVNTYLENHHNCGTVGARLHFEDNKIQHSGVFIGKTKTSHIRVGHIGYKTAYQLKNVTYNVFGNTAALMLISRSLFEKIGCFNEQYDGCFEDVELNIECLIRKCKNYLVGEAVAYHLESQTRTDTIAQSDYDKLTDFAKKNIEKISEHVVEI
jgi:GT2 family glycosyltransferase